MMPSPKNRAENFLSVTRKRANIPARQDAGKKDCQLGDSEIEVPTTLRMPRIKNIVAGTAGEDVKANLRIFYPFSKKVNGLCESRKILKINDLYSIFWYCAKHCEKA